MLHENPKALNLAFDNQHYAIIKMLVEKGADLKTIDPTLIVEAHRKKDKAAIEFLRKYLSQEVVSEILSSAKNYAGQTSAIPMTKEIAKTLTGQRLLTYAQEGAFEIVILALQNGAGLEVSIYTKTLLLLSITNGRLGLVKLMLDKVRDNPTTKDKLSEWGEFVATEAVSVANENNQNDMIPLLSTHAQIPIEVKDEGHAINSIQGIRDLLYSAVMESDSGKINYVLSQKVYIMHVVTSSANLIEAISAAFSLAVIQEKYSIAALFIPHGAQLNAEARTIPADEKGAIARAEFFISALNVTPDALLNNAISSENIALIKHLLGKYLDRTLTEELVSFPKAVLPQDEGMEPLISRFQTLRIYEEGDSWKKLAASAPSVMPKGPSLKKDEQRDPKERYEDAVAAKNEELAIKLLSAHTKEILGDDPTYAADQATQKDLWSVVSKIFELQEPQQKPEPAITGQPTAPVFIPEITSNAAENGLILAELLKNKEYATALELIEYTQNDVSYDNIQVELLVQLVTEGITEDSEKSQKLANLIADKLSCSINPAISLGKWHNFLAKYQSAMAELLFHHNAGQQHNQNDKEHRDRDMDEIDWDSMA